jgi:hypothetical protein
MLYGVAVPDILSPRLGKINRALTMHREKLA